MRGVAWRGVAFVPGIFLVLVSAVACDSGSGGAAVRLEPAFDGRVFDAPVELVAEPGGTFLLAEQAGRVLRLDPADSPPEEVLDISGRVSTKHREEGLLSLALDPAFVDNSHIWLYYSAAEPRRTVLSRFTMTAGGAIAPASELVALEVPQPYGNHNGGAIRFGPDGMLYLGIGDGGDAWDPHGNGQNPATLLATIIRIDVGQSRPGQPYTVPVDNPFVDDMAIRSEVWAFGIRNPWRMSFDSKTGELWVGDVGQDLAEEVDIVEPGNNYGWSIMEGFQCLDDPCPEGLYTEPLFAYGHETGCAITGGIVYRGDAIPHLEGRYVYGDLCSGEIWAFTPGEGNETLASVGGAVVSFAEGHEHELYVIQFGAPILRLATSSD